MYPRYILVTMVADRNTVKLKHTTLERIDSFLQARMTLEPDLQSLVLDSGWDAKINAVLNLFENVLRSSTVKEDKN